MKFLFLLLMLVSACAVNESNPDGKSSFYTIDESCIGCKACITDFSCPASAIQFDNETNKAFINPDKCIDCGQCYNYFSPKKCPPNAFREKGVKNGSSTPEEVKVYKVDDEKCVSCKKCITEFDCPVSAISIAGDEGKAVIDPEKCIGCGECKSKEFCPTDAFDEENLQDIGSIPVFNSDYGTIDTNTEVTFVYAVESKGGTIDQILFSAGDGSSPQLLTETEGFVSHTYKKHGCFAAKLTLKIDGTSIYATREITITTLEPKFITSFNADVVLGKEPLTVTYSIGVESFGNDYALSVQPFENAPIEELEKTDSIYVTSYEKPGVYTAKLFITGKDLSDSVEQTITTTLTQEITVVSKDTELNTDSLAVVNTANRLSFDDIAGFNSSPVMIYDHLILPTTFENTTVEWTSSSTVISTTGDITRDAFETDVTLTATLTTAKNNSAIKEFKLIVLEKDWNYHDVKEDECIGCERCIKSQCPDAIVMVNGKAVINPVLCWGCQEQGCHALRACPVNAITDVNAEDIHDHLKDKNNE